VVDDGSDDNTGKIAQDSGVRVIIHSRNLGKGAALRNAFMAAMDANYDAVITMDADLQHPPELIPSLIEPIEHGADIVVGNRMHDISSMPFERRFSNFLSTFFTSIWAGTQLKDSQCGFRAIRCDLLRESILLTNRYQLESEMLIEAGRKHAKMAFVDIPTLYNGNRSSFRPIADTARFIAFLLSYYPKRWLRAE
jgi:glycosyltransferase involved in cell wall biosynthesis